jgi:hypothetical protein
MEGVWLRQRRLRVQKCESFAGDSRLPGNSRGIGGHPMGRVQRLALSRGTSSSVRLAY